MLAALRLPAGLIGLSLLLLAGLSPAAPDAAPAGGPADLRFFMEVQKPGFPGTYHTLARFGYNGDFVLMVETDAERRPISDTLLVWVQHHDAEHPLADQSRWADLIIACHPDLLPQAALERHVLPEGEGKVWIYFLEQRFLAVAGERHPALELITNNF